MMTVIATDDKDTDNNKSSFKKEKEEEEEEEIEVHDDNEKDDDDNDRGRDNHNKNDNNDNDNNNSIHNNNDDSLSCCFGCSCGSGCCQCHNLLLLNIKKLNILQSKYDILQKENKKLKSKLLLMNQTQKQDDFLLDNKAKRNANEREMESASFLAFEMLNGSCDQILEDNIEEGQQEDDNNRCGPHHHHQEASFEFDLEEEEEGEETSAGTLLHDDNTDDDDDDENEVEDDKDNNKAKTSSPVLNLQQQQQQTTKENNNNNNNKKKNMMMIKSSTDVSSSVTTSCCDCDEDESSNAATVVSFGSVNIREFERICGDHPDVRDTTGPPLALGWDYEQHRAVPVDTFEKYRESIQQQTISSNRNSNSSMNKNKKKNKLLEPLNGIERRNILQFGFGVTTWELDEAIKEAKRVKKQREQTIKQQLSQQQQQQGGGTIRSLLKVDGIISLALLSKQKLLQKTASSSLSPLLWKSSSLKSKSSRNSWGFKKKTKQQRPQLTTY